MPRVIMLSVVAPKQGLSQVHSTSVKLLNIRLERLARD